MADLDEQLRTYIDDMVESAPDAARDGGRSATGRVALRAVAVASVLVLVAVGVVLTRSAGRGPEPADTTSDEESGLPLAPDQPVAIAAGEALWVLTQAPNVGEPEPSDAASSLVRVDPDSRAVTATTELPIPADLIDVVGDSVWVTGYHADEVVRVDRETAEVIGSVALELDEPVCSDCEPEDASAFLPAWLTVAGHRLWVGTPRGEAVAIDPISGTIVERLTNLLPNALVDMTGAGSTLWLTFDTGGPSPVDAETGEVGTSLPSPTLPGTPNTGIDSASGLLFVHQRQLRTETPQVTIRSATGPEVVIERRLGTPLSDGADLWIVDQDTLRLAPADAESLADPTMGVVATVGLPRPAAVANGEYWYLPDDRSVARVTRNGEIDLIEVVADPDRPVAPVNVCPAARHPTGIVGPDALPAGGLDFTHVQRALDDAADSIALQYGAVETRIVPRVGFVFENQGTPEPAFDIRRGIDDYQIEIVLDSVADCPDAPGFIGRVPITFTT